MAGLLFAILVALAVAVYWLARPPAVFVIRIHNQRPRASHGTVTPAFLNFVIELCDQYQIRSGEIRGVARGSRIALWFPRGMPLGFRQRLRNWWAISGWKAATRRRPDRDRAA